MKDFNLKVLFQSESILNLINESLLTRNWEQEIIIRIAEKLKSK